jgi:hypothetical protein
VTAIPKSWDFSDCFTWALLARPGAIWMNGADESGAALSRLSRVAGMAPEWKVSGGRFTGLWDVRTRWSRVTRYFRPASVR